MSAGAVDGKRRAIWAAMLAPLAAWACQGGLGVLVTSAACDDRNATLARGFVLACSAAALAVAAISATFARRRLRELGVGARPFRVEGTRNEESMALWALASATLFGLAALWTAFPAILLHGVCEVGR
jgi:hypothetical protein